MYLKMSSVEMAAILSKGRWDKQVLNLQEERVEIQMPSHFRENANHSVSSLKCSVTGDTMYT